jgi:hypothetical protein
MLRDGTVGYAFTMSQLGTPVKGPIRKMYEAVHTLHKLGFAHGDARLPNLLDVGGVCKWADFGSCPVAGPATFEKDLLGLTNSILRVDVQSAVAPTLAKAMKAYAQHPCLLNLAPVVDAVTLLVPV